MRHQRHGFTLFELVLVCALLVILAAILIPNLDYMYADTRVTAAADMVKGRLAEALSHAIEEGRPYRFEIIDATHCRVIADSGEVGQSNNNGNGNGAGAGDADNEDTLPKNVSFDLSNVGDNGGVKVVFLPDGTTRDDAEICLTSPGAQRMTLKLRALTATLKAIRQAEGNR
jgi:prepilin-type N-terminal cleavage/methylation domain-containing protein